MKLGLPCCKCQETVKEWNYWVVAMDRPKRLNLFFHRECKNELGENIYQFIEDNLETILKLYENA